MTIAYFDCFSGVSGDMVLGALVDAGMPIKYLKGELKKIPLGSYEIKLQKRKEQISGSDISVLVRSEPHHDDYKSLDRLIAKSRFSSGVKDLSREIFETLAKAEAKVHGVSINKVHFHEVGAVDSIVDVVGAAIGFDYFDFKNIYSSPLPMTRGIVKCAHGSFPVPAPATLEILKGVPFERAPIHGEIVTPTGAAILKTVVENFGECPLQKIEKIGYGFGDKKIPGRLNALRILMGEGFPVVVIEADIDDMNPQFFDMAIDHIFKAGAVDACLMPIQMKKNRPAVRLAALAPWDKKGAVIDVFLKETTTFGVRYFPVERKMLTRELVTKKVKKGKVTFKIGYDSKGNIIRTMPEYEDLKRQALSQNCSIIDVYRKAIV